MREIARVFNEIVTGVKATSSINRRLLPYRLLMRVLLWMAGVPAVLILALYIVLWITPIPVPFVRDQAVANAERVLPPNMSIEFGETVLALEYGLYPIFRFSPVTIKDSDTGAHIEMEALHVAFSPFMTLIGQPGVSATMVEPHIQLVQDLLGPRLASYELVQGENGGNAAIWVIEGEKAAPSITIGSEGINLPEALSGGLDGQLRSDNEWLINNLLAMEEGLSAFVQQTANGVISRLRVRDGRVDMHDAIYGLLRQFSGIDLDIAPSPLRNGVGAKFAMTLAERDVEGEMLRSINEDGSVELDIGVRNIDFAMLLPFLDDPDATFAVRGAGNLDVSASILPQTQVVEGAVFEIDLTGTSLRIKQDYFPVQTENLTVEWEPETAQFKFNDVNLTIGESSGELSGLLAMGLDETYGPTLSMSLKGSDVLVHPNDLDAPEEPFDEITLSGWSAPLYGAVGIDGLIVRKGDMVLQGKGRADLLRSGIGLDMLISGHGATTDDLKRLWPYFISDEARNWFVSNALEGHVEAASMRLAFPPGSISSNGEDRPIPPGALSIDITGTNVVLTPMEGVEPISIAGLTNVKVEDAKTTIGLNGATLDAGEGPVNVKDVAFIIDTRPTDRYVYEVSGSVSGKIPAILAVVESNAPGRIESVEMPIDPLKLEGDVDGTLVSTIVMNTDGTLRNLDYAANGTVGNFESGQPVEGYEVNKGQLAFTVTPTGFAIMGDAQTKGVDIGLNVNGPLDGDPEVRISAELDAEKIKEFGFDPTGLLAGKLRFAARPLDDGAVQLAADLTDARLTVTDIGITKEAGVPGRAEAEIRPEDGKLSVENIKLAFEDVDIQGRLTVGSENEFEAAEFSPFKLSPGDKASLSVSPRDGGGVNLRLRGEQLDLKPMLNRFFALDAPSTGGPQSTQFDEAINLDVQLSRAVGFYQTSAYNLDLDLLLVGTDLRHVSMQAQFAENSSVSIATNPVDGGRSMSVAVNDAGTLLRFLNVYPRLLGGRGSLNLTHSTSQGAQRGVLRLRDFSLVDEEKVKEVLGNHRDSRQLVASQNRLNFNDSRVEFIRSWDRIEVVDAVLDGDSTGGTMRGFVYTVDRKYDLTGTYVPLFALNNFFQKLPLIGEIVGGRDGEGLVGVTFAVRGDLDKPEFIINPASILLPGAFRSLMEFRANEAPGGVD